MELSKPMQVALFLLRFGVGLLLIAFAFFEKQNYSQEGFRFFLFSLADKGALPFYKPFILSYLFPNAHVVFQILTYSYFVMGGLLCLGLFVRVVAWYMIVIAGNLFCALFYSGVQVQAFLALILLLSFCFMLGNFGKVAGLDALLKRKSKNQVPLEDDIMAE